MFINKPPALENQIGAALSAMLAGEKFDMNALYTLELLTDLVHEPRIKGLLLRLVAHPMPAVRRSVGRSLAQAGYGEGLQCLTWCALGTHPVLKHSQRAEKDSNARTVSKQHLFPFVRMLDNELIQMLVDDLADPRGNHHIDLLSAVPLELTSAKLEPLLSSKDARLQAAAAFVLGRNGREDVRPILENEISKGRNIELALLALSHIPNARVMELLEYFETEEHSPHRKWANDPRRIRLTMLAKRRHFLLSNASAHRSSEALGRFFRKEYPEYSHQSASPRLYRVGSRWEGASRENDENTESTADFIAEFLSGAERAACVEDQKEAMKLVKRSPAFQPRRTDVVFDFLLGPLIEPKGKFLPGVTLFFDDPDYDFSATDWIQNAEHYRVGTLSEF